MATFTSGSSVFVIGEALIDIVHPCEGPTTEHVGGSPLNVAVALGRLERDVSLLSAIGDDARGHLIAAHAQDSSVKLVEGTAQPTIPTSTAAAMLDAEGAASYEFAISWHLSEGAGAKEAATAGWIHTGSIAATLQPGATQIREMLTAAKTQALISYDPNARPTLMPAPDETRQIVEANLALADVVKASDEDIAWLYPDSQPREVLAHWLTLGPAVAVMTRGGDGALAAFADGFVEVPGVSVTVVDTVGAGDTFSAGIIDALISQEITGADARQALRAISPEKLTAVLSHAASCAAITVSRAGANPPHRAEL